MSDVTPILSKIEAGDAKASEQLLPLVYDELRKLASRRMQQESPEHTLQATALVHDAYIRLVDVDQAQHWGQPRALFAAAAESMRRILIDHARKKARIERGGDLQEIDLDAIDVADCVSPESLLRIDEALTSLAQEDPAAAEIVKLRYFAGLSVEQAAEVLAISPRTAYRHWNYARAWLCGELLEAGE